MINPNDTFAGQWEKLRPKMRQQWKALTDDDLDRAEGSTDVLASILSEKYGYAREKAFQEIHQFAQANLGPVKVGNS